MIAWWWVLVAFVAGELIGIGLLAVCTANEPERKQGEDGCRKNKA